MITLLRDNEKPDWVEYPKLYVELINNGQDEFLPWYLMNKDQLLTRYCGLHKRYPERILFLFARDDNSDDIACWEKGKSGRVILIHDFASPGYEDKMEFSSFEEWYTYITK